MNKTNHLDEIFEKFFRLFNNNPDLKILSEDEDAKTFFFHQLMPRLIDLHLYGDWYNSNILPAVTNSINKAILDYNRSKYKSNFGPNFTNIIKAGKPEFINYAYVVGFHKFEVYVKALEKYILKKWEKNIEDKSISYDKYCQKIIGVKMKDEWHKFNRLHLIQFIANSTKHHDGFPLSKYQKPDEFSEWPENQKIERSSKQLKDDMAFLSELTIQFYQLFDCVMLHKFINEVVQSHSEFNQDPLVIDGTIEPLDTTAINDNLRHIDTLLSQLKNNLLYEEYAQNSIS